MTSIGAFLKDDHRFCIKMPILHRLACFRDDVVFLVFLYQVSGDHDSCRAFTEPHWSLQRWIYRIDPKRVNEYGQVMAWDADAIAGKDGKADMETKKNK